MTEFDLLLSRQPELVDDNNQKDIYIERVIEKLESLLFRGGENIDDLDELELAMLLYQEYTIICEIMNIYGENTSEENGSHEEQMAFIRFTFDMSGLKSTLMMLNKGEEIKGLKGKFNRNLEIYLKMRELGWVKGNMPSIILK